MSRVPEHAVIKDKIAEDETENTYDQHSPESTQNSIRVVPSPSLLHSHQPSDSDTCAVSDSEKSLKSQGKEVPVNINDLQEQLTRLTRGGTATGNQLDLSGGLQTHPSENHSPVPGEDGSSQLSHSQGQSSHQLSTEKSLPGDNSSHEKQSSVPPSGQQPSQPMHNPQPSVGMQPGQQQASMPGMMQQGQQGHQSNNQPLPTSIQQPQPGSSQQPPAQQSVPSQKPVQQQGSTEMPPNPNMPSAMYPQHMQYFPMMQQPMYGFPHHGSGGMMQMYPDQMHPMQYLQMPNQMVPYVMINVQQQHQVSPMLVPANMIMSNQMQYMGSHSGSHLPHQHSDGHSESVIMSPPGTPPQSRKQHSIETQSDSGIPSDISSPAPMRGNYSIANLEQELIRKLHGGTRKDIPMAASGSVLGESFSSMEASGTRLHEDRPQWTQSHESLSSVQSVPADLSESLKKVEESDDINAESAATIPKTAPKKKLRFQVERVKDDPLKVPEATVDNAQSDTGGATQSVSESGDKDTPSEQDKKIVKPAKLGRFSVTKIVEKTKSIDEPETDNEDTEAHKSVIKGNEQSSSESKDSKDVETLYDTVPNTIREESEEKASTSDVLPSQGSAEFTSIPDKPLVSKLQLHDLPYRKKSMSFFEGNNSPMLSNNTCDSFYNSHMDRFQIFSRRRTKSLGSLQPGGSMQSISMQTQCTQYGDGETPSPSPSPRDHADGDFPGIVFDLAPVIDEMSSVDSDTESQDGAESGIDSGSRIISPRPPLRRQCRKVREGNMVKRDWSMRFPNTISNHNYYQEFKSPFFSMYIFNFQKNKSKV